MAAGDDQSFKLQSLETAGRTSSLLQKYGHQPQICIEIDMPRTESSVARSRQLPANNSLAARYSAVSSRCDSQPSRASTSFLSMPVVNCNFAVITLHCVISVVVIPFPCLLFRCCMGHKLRSLVIGNYRKSVDRVRKLALINCWIVRLNSFLGYCVLTWASVIVLGGFISNLSKFYFELVSALLILQALQFGAAAVWRSFLPPRRLVSGRKWKQGAFHSFRSIIHLQRDRYFVRVEVYCIVLMLLLSFGHLFKLIDIHLCGKDQENVVLNESLYVFLWLVFLNGLIATAGLLCGRILFYYKISPCLGDYFYSIIRVSMQCGLRDARKVTLIDTLFEMMGEEYGNHVKTEADQAFLDEVIEIYEHVMEYVYNHEGGFEATLNAMESEDRHLQEVVVCMVGFWVDRVEAPKISSDKELLAHRSASSTQNIKQLHFQGPLIRKLIELAQLACTGRTARATVKTLHKLAKHDPSGVLVAQKDIVALLARQIADVVVLGEQPRGCETLPILIKTLIELLMHLQSAPATSTLQQNRYLTSEQRGQLEETLLAVFKCPSSSKRVQAVAGYALHKTLQSNAFSDSILMRHLMASEAAPGFSEDIPQDEHDTYFHYLTSVIPAQWDTVGLLKITDNKTTVDSECPSSCSACRRCSWRFILSFSIRFIIEMICFVVAIFALHHLVGNCSD